MRAAQLGENPKNIGIPLLLRLMWKAGVVPVLQETGTANAHRVIRAVGSVVFLEPFVDHGGRLGDAATDSNAHRSRHGVVRRIAESS